MPPKENMDKANQTNTDIKKKRKIAVVEKKDDDDSDDDFQPIINKNTLKSKGPVSKAEQEKAKARTQGQKNFPKKNTNAQQKPITEAEIKTKSSSSERIKKRRRIIISGSESESEIDDEIVSTKKEGDDNGEKNKGVNSLSKNKNNKSKTVTSSGGSSSTSGQLKYLENSSLWTDKYKPKTISDIVGNHDTVDRISQWLAEWKKGFSKRSGLWSKSRALLISGPCGVGKNTAVILAANENRYEIIEYNAGDIRSKKVLRDNLMGAIQNKSITDFYHTTDDRKNIREIAKKQRIDFDPKVMNEKDITNILAKKTLLVFDEVDCMLSGDSEGVETIIELIKISKIPIICICNDRNSPEARTLLTCCSDVGFIRVPTREMKKKINYIALNEKLNIQQSEMENLFLVSRNDIRKTINSLWTGDNTPYPQVIKSHEIPKILLNPKTWEEKTINQISEVYFHDHEQADAWIMENYINTIPKENKNNHLDLTVKALEAIGEGDFIRSKIDGNTFKHNSLMPSHSILSCVRPSSFIYGATRRTIQFPSWFYNNSLIEQYAYLLANIQSRIYCRPYINNFEAFTYAIPLMSRYLFKSLNEEDYLGAVEIMDEFNLDTDSIDIITKLQSLQRTAGVLRKIKVNNNEHIESNELALKTEYAFSKLPPLKLHKLKQRYKLSKHRKLFYEGGAATEERSQIPGDNMDDNNE